MSEPVSQRKCTCDPDNPALNANCPRDGIGASNERQSEYYRSVGGRENDQATD